jgi:FAD/FMN-containing dehydrogenase
MNATPSLTFPCAHSPRVYSADDLCRAMRAPRLVLPDASGLDRVLRHDAAHGLLEVQSGAPWSALAAHGGGAFGTGTVGAGVAANAAGPDGQPLVAHVRSITVASADGELRRASRERAPDLFRLAVGGFGIFGPFYSVTLDIVSIARAAASAAVPVCLGLPCSEAEGVRFAVELLLPPHASEAFVRQARAELESRRARLSRFEARRTMPEDTTFLRWARRDFAALHIEYRMRDTVGGHLSGTQLRARLIELAIAAGGSFSPAHLPDATRAQAAHCYPMLGEFLAEKRRYDPAERVAGTWYRDVRSLWQRGTGASRGTRD